MKSKIIQKWAPILAMVFLWMTTSYAQVDTTRFPREKCINTFTPAKIESTKAGYQYWFIDKNFLDGRTLKMSVVRPREATHPPHQHVEDEFFFILEGTAEIFLQGQWTKVTPYTSIYCPPNEMHGIRNAGNTELKYLVIKKYQK